MTVRWTVRADGDQGAQFAPRPSPIRVAKLKIPADLAHLVERHLAKVEVAGSSPVIRSKKSKDTRKECLFAFSGRCRGIRPPRTSPRFCGFSPVHSCVVAHRLRPLGSADSHSVDIASAKKVINLFYLALTVRLC